jgi:hypothetical protein
MRGLDGALRLQKGCVSQPAGDRKPSIMSCRDSPKMARSFRDGPGRNFDPLPHAPGSSPYVFTDDYLLGLMKDDVPRTCTYGRS